MKKAPTRSLFRRPKPRTPIVETLKPEELLEALRPILGGSRYPVEVALAKISRDAELASGSSEIPDADEHVRDIRIRLEDVRREIADQAVSREQLAYSALKLAESWMMLRMDAIAAKSVRQDEARAKQTVTDAQIAEALRTEGTQAKAAAKLGIDARTIRLRLKKKRK